MNKELFDSMKNQMTPSPEVRAALSEKLAQPMKKRPAAWMKYGAVAACAALVIGALAIYQAGQPEDVSNSGSIHHHSYVMVGDVIGDMKEFAATTAGGEDTGASAGENSDAPNTGDLPGGAYVGEIPVQEGAEAYQKLMDRFNGTYPDWYGGAYLDDSGRLVVQLVEDKDPGDKSLELQVLDWTDSDSVMFSSCKYSLSHLNELMEELNKLPDTDPEYRRIMNGWGIDEEANHIKLTITEVNNSLLADLTRLDPEDNGVIKGAIYVQVGQRAAVDSTNTEEPAVHHVMPGGATVPGDEDPIADEPQVDENLDGAYYGIQNLPQKLPAIVESVPEKDIPEAGQH
ncbi:hypothetical protein [Hungatella effluvii]|uniref:hypothetical protein n=1 Tax=Hungatella effluvii TaxID=1096246 RepID=UPI002A821760|nr:hypothetical protein [Hungatella effluvii]